MDFMNKIVMVTGASRGIGLASARAFAAKGGQVILTARNEAKLQEAVAGIQSAGGLAWSHRMDVTSDNEVQIAVEAALARFGRIDILINNAGVSCQGYFSEIPLRDSRYEFEVNCVGLMRVTHAILPAMIARRGGIIFNISSMLGMAPFPTGSSYSATKAAVIAFSQALRGEVAPLGIHVGVFMPGHTSTDMGEKLIMKGAPAPVPVELVAKDILEAVSKKRKLATISGLNAQIGLQFMRHMPTAAEKMMYSIAQQSLPLNP